MTLKQVLAIFWYNGNTCEPVEMQGGSHNYKTITVTHDPSFHLKGKEIFHRERNTHARNGVKKLGQNQRQGWEQSCRKKSHRRVLATKARSWFKGGQSMAARSTVNVSLSVFLQALMSSPLVSLKSLLSYTLQAKSNFSASSSESLLLLLLFIPAWGTTLRGNHKKPPCSLQAPA